MKEPASHVSSARRTFLKTAVAAGGVTVLSTANATPVDEISQQTEPAVPEPVAESTGYHETDHIKHYYKTLRE